MEIIEWFLIILGMIFVILVIPLFLALLSYRRLSVTVKSVGASPDFKFKPSAVVGGLIGALTGNFAGAAAGFVNGVKVDFRLDCRNRSFMPLYFPDIEHAVLVAGLPCSSPARTKALWLAPGGCKTVPVDIVLDTSEIPQIALEGITHKGVIDIEIRSKICAGPFSYSKTTKLTTKIPDYLPKFGRGGKSIKTK